MISDYSPPKTPVAKRDVVFPSKPILEKIVLIVSQSDQHELDLRRIIDDCIDTRPLLEEHGQTSSRCPLEDGPVGYQSAHLI